MPGRTFFFPVLFWYPEGEFDSVSHGRFGLVRRRWQTSLFDLATLATKHCIHIPYQLMDVFLAKCNLELAIEGGDFHEALEELQFLLLGFFLNGVSPSFAPFGASHSINSYSGINIRDSEMSVSTLPDGLQGGPTSKEITVEVWPVQLSLYCKVFSGAMGISVDTFYEAAEDARRWAEMESQCPALKVVRGAMLTAPIIPSSAQSFLHMWAALESLFPTVGSEVSLRLALYLTQLVNPPGKRRQYFERIRESYGVRSRVAHGSVLAVSDDQWETAWELLRDAVKAIIGRGRLPGEKELLLEIIEG